MLFISKSLSKANADEMLRTRHERINNERKKINIAPFYKMAERKNMTDINLIQEKMDSFVIYPAAIYQKLY